MVAEHLAHRLLEPVDLGIAGGRFRLQVGEREAHAARLAAAEQDHVAVAVVAHHAAAAEVRVAHDAADAEAWAGRCRVTHRLRL